ELALVADGKRRCGVGGLSGGLRPGASGPPGVVCGVIMNSNSRHAVSVRPVVTIAPEEGVAWLKARF
ncbi:MAG: hypothetical protein ACPIOQ_85710, partial [Promethearchaeia archaeon]